MCFKVFSKFLIGFNGFQIVCFKLFPNNVFQSVLKNLPNVSMVFKLCVSKCFQNSPIGFNVFQIVCFQNVFQSVFKNLS